MEMTKLQVGDVLYLLEGDNISKQERIDAVDGTRAKTKAGIQFHRDIMDGWIRRVKAGPKATSTKRYVLATKVLDDRYEKQILIKQINSLDLQNLSVKTLTKIRNVLENAK